MSKFDSEAASQLGKDLKIKERFAHIGSSLFAAVVSITPQMAKKWLDERNLKNRRIKTRSVEKYARDMKNNRWHLTNEALAFSTEGVLVNGQHRLEAIILSNETVEIVVFLGLQSEDGAFIDEGITRSAADAARLKGIPVPKRDLGTIKYVFNSAENIVLPLSNSEILELVEPYTEGLQHLHNILPSKQRLTASAVVRAAILRAYYWCKENDPAKLDRLKTFCQILSDGQYGKRRKDKSAFLLYQKMLKEKFFGQTRDLYLLVENTLQTFLEGRHVNRLTPALGELFPIKSVPTRQKVRKQRADVA